MAKHFKSKKGNKKQKKIMLVFILLFFIGVIGIIFSINKNNKIIGIWDFDGNTKYEFQKNNIGYLKVPINDYKFKYYIKDNKLYIDFENNESEDTSYEYKIKNNKLILKNINGIFEFNKIKD